MLNRCGSGWYGFPYRIVGGSQNGFNESTIFQENLSNIRMGNGLDGAQNGKNWNIGYESFDDFQFPFIPNYLLANYGYNCIYCMSESFAFLWILWKDGTEYLYQLISDNVEKF